MKALWEIAISQVDNGGYIVRAGCKTLVYVDLEQLLADLLAYFRDPEKVAAAMSEKHWPSEKLRPSEPTVGYRETTVAEGPAAIDRPSRNRTDPYPGLLTVTPGGYSTEGRLR